MIFSNYFQKIENLSKHEIYHMLDCYNSRNNKSQTIDLQTR